MTRAHPLCIEAYGDGRKEGKCKQTGGRSMHGGMLPGDWFGLCEPGQFTPEVHADGKKVMRGPRRKGFPLDSTVRGRSVGPETKSYRPSGAGTMTALGSNLGMPKCPLRWSRSSGRRSPATCTRLIS